MSTRNDAHLPDDEILAVGEPDAPVTAWSLDELDDELGAIRSAWMETNDAT